ncbi:MAG TPA: DUF937 domain-containing protein [Burkholderiaceae bacterium]|nr:DUF937 domain-containing protein [Burkholderiaceae bacterium]
MNESLAEQLFAQLQGAPIEQMSRQLGSDPQQTAGAVGAALPLLLGALGRNTAQPQGAQALFGALQRDHAGNDLGSVLGGVLGGMLGGGRTEASGGNNEGASILGHIFGANEQRTEAAFGQATGLGGAGAAKLLQMLAPIVMSFLAQRFAQGGGHDPAELGQALGFEERQARTGQGGDLLGALLDQDGDGRVDIGDLVKLGAGLFGGRR